MFTLEGIVAGYAEATVLRGPDRRVPLLQAALEHLGAPYVVDEHVDVAKPTAAQLRGEISHLSGIEMIDAGCDSRPAEFSDEIGCFVNSFGPVAIGPG